ncbi:MAG: DUF4445 domain-containing protein [Lachnospiraceae bacterium]|nr:DUF4445 domain-containing protein [Lachnospiraceae bacterium]
MQYRRMRRLLPLIHGGAMSKTYCGACRGERGCRDCRAVAGTAHYTGLTDFYADDTIPVRTEEDGFVQENDAKAFCDKVLFLAADLGTTTLAFVCADQNGKVLASYGCENPQRKVAADVVGRIDASLHGQGEKLTNEIREALVKGFLFVLNRGQGKVCGTGRGTEEITIQVAIAGNTVMQHILLGYPLGTMARAPFEPYKKETVRCDFSALFGETSQASCVPQMLKQAEVTVFPCLSAFVGGDIVAGAEAVFTGRKDCKELLIDLGTNGEILLSAKGCRYGTAAAMGSAFEGGRYAYASELFGKIADALKRGIMDETGLLCEPYFTGGYEGLLQEDVREFQLAKGALRAGIELICRYGHVELPRIDRVYLAGGLGQYCNQEDLFTTSLLPKEFKGKVTVVGNSCIGGMLSVLKKRKTVIYCEGEILNLAEQPEFEALYYRFMNFEK